MELLTYVPFPFTGGIFRSVMPFSIFDRKGIVLEKFKEEKIRQVVVLTQFIEMPVINNLYLTNLYYASGFDYLLFPIKDMSAPFDMASFVSLVFRIIDMAEKGENVAVHCLAGLGRTGMVLSAVAMKVFGMKAKYAVHWIREFIPRAVESNEQFEFLENL